MPSGSKDVYKYGEKTRFAGDRAVELGKKGALASAESRRKNKTMRQAAQAILSGALSFGGEEIAAILQQLGVENPTNADGFLVAAALKACKGDVDALRFVRDTAGEVPKAALELSGDLSRPLAALDMRSLSNEELAALAEKAADDEAKDAE